jgi:hypothetical protein
MHKGKRTNKPQQAGYSESWGSAATYVSCSGSRSNSSPIFSSGASAECTTMGTCRYVARNEDKKKYNLSPCASAEISCTFKLCARARSSSCPPQTPSRLSYCTMLVLFPPHSQSPNGSVGEEGRQNLVAVLL